MFDNVAVKGQLELVLNNMFDYIDGEATVIIHTYKAESYPVFNQIATNLCSTLRISGGSLLKFKVDTVDDIGNFLRYVKDLGNVGNLGEYKVITPTLLLNNRDATRVSHYYSPGYDNLVGSDVFQVFVDANFSEVEDVIDFINATVNDYVKKNIGKLLNK